MTWFPIKIILLLLLNGLSPGTAAESENNGRPPDYARLFEQVEALERDGRYEQALRSIPPIYRTRIPVDAFYATLERKKRQLVEALKRSGKAGLDDNCCSIAELRYLYGDLVSRPELLHHHSGDSSAIPFDHFIYARVALSEQEPARERSNTGDPLILQAIDSLDPWLTAAGVFMARKSAIGNKIRKTLYRWQRRPDLWGETAERQTLRLIARLTPGQLRDLARDIENPDIRRAVSTLRPIASQTCELQPLPLDPDGNPMRHAADMLKNMLLEEFSVIHMPPPVGGAAGAAPDLQSLGVRPLNSLKLRPTDGWYRLRLVSERFHGGSKHFRCRSDSVALVPLVLYPNI